MTQKEIVESIVLDILEGGAGSGNWGHKGRLGKRGGSLPTKGGSIAKHILKSETGHLRISGKLFRAARKSRDLEVILSGSPRKMLMRLINKYLGRHFAGKIYR